MAGQTIRDVVVRGVDRSAERGAGYSEEPVVHDRVADVRIEGAAGAPPLFARITMRSGRHHVLPMAFVAATLITGPVMILFYLLAGWLAPER